MPVTGKLLNVIQRKAAFEISATIQAIKIIFEPNPKIIQ